MTALAYAFEQHWVADVTRLVLCSFSLVLVGVCLKVSWLRARSPEGSPLRQGSPWAVLSYGLFAFIPTALAFRNLGKPLDPLLTPIFVVALSAGVLAMYGEITIRLRKRRVVEPPPPATSPEDGPGQ